MEKINESIASWPSLSNGIHYNWLVDYPAYSAFGTYELSNEDWEKRDFIQNFKGNSELTTETDHQQAMSKAISLVSDYVIEHFGEEAKRSACSVCQPPCSQPPSAVLSISAIRCASSLVWRISILPSPSHLRWMRLATL